MAAVVLAAGLGTRMGGRIKPLLRIGNVPLLQHVVSVLDEAGYPSPIIVLGHGRHEILSEIDLSACRIAVNPDPALGLGSSLRTGLDAVDPDACGALVVHADMPFLSPATIRAVAEAARGSLRKTPEARTVVAPAYRGKRGFPVFLPRTLFDEIKETCFGDHGAREYLARHPDELALLAVDDPGCLADIDTESDRENAERMNRCSTPG